MSFQAIGQLQPDAPYHEPRVKEAQKTADRMTVGLMVSELHSVVTARAESQRKAIEREWVLQ